MFIYIPHPFIIWKAHVNVERIHVDDRKTEIAEKERCSSTLLLLVFHQSAKFNVLYFYLCVQGRHFEILC